MKKATITVSFEQEKLKAVQFYLTRSDTSLETELDTFMEKLYRKYGLVSFVSYLYFLLYELLSPYIEVFGVLTMVLASILDFLNVPFMLLYLGIYIVYTAILSLTAFFARMHTNDLTLSAGDVLKAVGLCAVEVSCLRFVLAWVRMTALIGYRKRKTQWEKIERKKISFK